MKGVGRADKSSGRHVRRLPTFRAAGVVVLMLGLLCLAGPGCTPAARVLTAEEQRPIDRAIVETPAGLVLQPFIRSLTAPSAIAFDANRSILIAESGAAGDEPHIFGFRIDGTRFDIYPYVRRLPFNLGGSEFRIYGPVGGITVHDGKVYVSHRDANDRGVITALGYDGSHTTIVADLPAQGDYGVTDLVFGPNNRLYFGVGAATNSGVVGVDNFQTGWVPGHLKFCDQPWTTLRLRGVRLNSPNPLAGLFGPPDLAVTAPFQPFDQSNKTRVFKAPNGKPSSAVYSVAAMGGDLRVEAVGIRYPRGLAVNEFGRIYATNNGMEQRGTRPVKDDPDALLRIVPGGTWYGWPDYSADLYPIKDERFQPPPEMILRSGYPDIDFVIDHEASGLVAPDRETLLQASFPSLSGAAHVAFVPAGAGRFKDFRNQAIVALFGDRAPFATSGRKLRAPQGRKVMRVDVDSKQVSEFVRNTSGRAASEMGPHFLDALERPIDLKFGPDGALYILDFGRVEVKNGKDRITRGTGQIFRLVPEDGLYGERRDHRHSAETRPGE